MKRRNLAWLALGLATSGLIACGSDGGSKSAGAPAAAGAGATETVVVPATGPIPVEAMPQGAAEAICNKVDKCGCNWATSEPCVTNRACNLADCITYYKKQYTVANSQSLASGRVYDPDGTRRCVDAVNAADCLDVDYINLCTQMWNGTVELGGACSYTKACKTSATVPAECGANDTCVAPSASVPGAAAGDACSGTCKGSSCVVTLPATGGTCRTEDGLACMGGKCAALRKAGETCAARFTCAEPLSCLNGVCSPRGASGAACTVTTDDPPCATGLGCVGSQCKPVKAIGQPCTTAAECSENNCHNGVCIAKFGKPICG